MPDRGSSFIDLLMKWGVAKTPQGAHRFLVFLIIICLAISFYFGYSLVVNQNSLSAEQERKILEDLERPARAHNIKIP
jgi:phosphotransferase system  glucose/maltose/N-acetylglucosamine-specific IIC component